MLIMQVFPPTISEILTLVGFVSFAWVPLVFVAYAVGRRQIGLNFVWSFIVVEAAAIWLAMYLF